MAEKKIMHVEVGMYVYEVDMDSYLKYAAVVAYNHAMVADWVKEKGKIVGELSYNQDTIDLDKQQGE